MSRLVCAGVVVCLAGVLGGCGAANSDGLTGTLTGHQAGHQEGKAPKRIQSDRILALVAITRVTGKKPSAFGAN